VSARLIGRSGPSAGLDYRLTDTARIGAAADSEVRIEARGVSRRHARIVVEADRYFLEDAGATNGTFVNGRQVTREALHHLDVITLGRAVDLIFLQPGIEDAGLALDHVTAARVEIIDGPEAGTVIEIPRGELTFGRAPSCDVVLASGLVSKVHARVQRTANQVLLQDAESVNGTFVNGKRVDAVQILKNGDLINFGGARTASVAIEETAAASKPVGRDEIAAIAVAKIVTPPDAEQTLVTSPPPAPRVCGLRLAGPGPPIVLGLGTFVVGRAVGSDVRLDDRQVSRSHARLMIDAASVSLEDLQTVNGTRVNGNEVTTQQPLHHGDTVQFGGSEFMIELITK